MKNKKIFLAILGFGIIITTSFILANHIISPSSFSVSEDIAYTYNITTQNTDILSISNITQINITIPTSFTFTSNTNATSATSSTFTNTTTSLLWNNDELVMNLTTEYFWFNATAATSGNYNLTIETTNSTGVQSSTISIEVNDTTSPLIEFTLPTDSNNSNLSRTYITTNITAEDNGIIDTITINLFNSSNILVNSTSSSTSPLFYNFTNLDYGTYHFNATVNDTFGNSNSTETRTVVLADFDPSITLITPLDAASSTSNIQTFTFSVLDNLTITNCSLILDGSISSTSTNINNAGTTNTISSSSLSIGDYTWGIYCIDSGNYSSTSETRTLSIIKETSSLGGSSGLPDFYPKYEELLKGFEKNMYKNWEVKFDVIGEAHNLKIEDISEAGVKIMLSSETQEATIKDGEERKFELSGDEYYDLLVKVNSIDGKKVNLFIQFLREHTMGEQSNDSIAGEKIEDSNKKEGSIIDAITGSREDGKKNLTWVWALLTIIIIIISYKIYIKKSTPQ